MSFQKEVERKYITNLEKKKEEETRGTWGLRARGRLKLKLVDSRRRGKGDRFLSSIKL